MARLLNEQVVVITGASSGIGRVAARMFAERGARVVCAARNQAALDDLVREIESSGGQAAALATDVTRREDVERLGEAALERFGRVDTWINNAGVSIYATFEKLTDEEARRIMDVNFIGVFNGMQTALRIMREQGEGTIINTASVTGKRAIPLQSVYSASKHAVVGLGEAVRSELAAGDAEISVCTICPPSIDTPFFDNALTKEGYAPRPMPPVYDPETVAEAMISCAENPQREVMVGAAGKMFSVMNTLAPGLTDWFLGATGISGQLSDDPKPASAPNNLFEVPQESRERGGWNGWGKRQGTDGRRQLDGAGLGKLIEQHPIAASAIGVAALAVTARLVFGGR